MMNNMMNNMMNGAMNDTMNESYENYTDYLLLFFLVLIEIWGAKFKKTNLLFFYLLLAFHT